METSAKNDAHIFRPFWIFELNHIVFELGHLNTINNLSAQIILKLNVGHWNNPERVHKLFQEFTKWVSTFTNSKQRKRNRKIERIRKRQRVRELPGSPSGWPSPPGAGRSSSSR